MKKGLIRLADLARGAAIGAAEVIPGVSGGTIALITGVYDTLIGSAATLIRAIAGSLRSAGRRERWQEVGALPWARVVTILLGMALAIVVAAWILEPLIDHYPEHTRAVFLGLILASLAIPLSMAGGIRSFSAALIVLPSAAAAFFLTGIPPTSFDSPSSVIVMLAAAVAVCALVLPGVSGSFLLVGIGLYQPTIEAVNNRDLGYLGVFAAGAVLGLSSFVVVLQWLLSHHQRLTLLVMAGLMAGSTRALWPWQTEDRALLAPTDNWIVMVGLALVGVLIVVALMRWEKALTRGA
jgi:putative membrane protein